MKYIPTIGLEMHCELKSNSKVFSPAKNSYDVTPNANVCAIDMAFPGILPVVNKECVRKAIMMAMALNCKVPEYMEFDRKNYYYPDLPKGYQITQFYNPVGVDGYVDIVVNGEKKRILIHDIHLEEDTAELTHLYNTTTLNYNRCGVPLLELVTEPSLHSTDEVLAYIDKVVGMYRYADISNVDTTKGELRCDVNVSIAPEGSKELGTKVEVKGVNSIPNIIKTIEYEIARQTKLIEAGKKDEIVQETRRFDETSMQTVHMRSKADAIDYKYFPEPNIPAYKITEEWKKEIKAAIPKFKDERKEEYINIYNLEAKDADIILKDKKHALYFEECVRIGIDPKTAANWFIVNILGYLNKEFISIDDFKLYPGDLKYLIDQISSGKISSKQAKEIFNKTLEDNKNLKDLVNQEGAQVSDSGELETIIDNILANNSAQIEAYHNGRTNLFDFFVGQVMKETKGKANPVITKEILNKKLNG